MKIIKIVNNINIFFDKVKGKQKIKNDKRNLKKKILEITFYLILINSS